MKLEWGRNCGGARGSLMGRSLGSSWSQREVLKVHLIVVKDMVYLPIA